MSVENIVNSRLMDYIEQSGFLPYQKQDFLYRNLASDEPYSLLNQSLLNVYSQENGLNNNMYFCSWSQLREHGGRITPNTKGALTTYYKDFTPGKFGLMYYWSFALCNTDIWRDFSAMQDERLAQCSEEIAKEIIDAGYKKMGVSVPDKPPSISMEDYYQQSIIALAELAEPKKGTGLVSELVSAYLLAKCGYRLEKTKIDPANLAKEMGANSYLYVRSAEQAAKRVKNILN